MLTDRRALFWSGSGSYLPLPLANLYLVLRIDQSQPGSNSREPIEQRRATEKGKEKKEKASRFPVNVKSKRRQ